MLKYAILAGAVAISGPALAQTAQAPAQTAPAQVQSDATTAAPADTTATPAQPQTTDPATAQQAQPAAGQIASVVDSEFPSYDANKDGKLSQSEFGSWMVALKEKSDPGTKADSAQTKQWVTAAFTQADADKNKALTKEELTSFLTQGQS